MLPPEVAESALTELLARIARSGQGSFLAVLKRFGDKPSLGMLSFPRPGVTIALDFPMRGAKTLRLMDELDEVVAEAGGVLYPAKDARMSNRLFKFSFRCYNRILPFIDNIFISDFGKRVNLRVG